MHNNPINNLFLRSFAALSFSLAAEAGLTIVGFLFFIV
jgi:hypothetical protein